MATTSFMTHRDTVKGRARRRDPRASLVVDEEVAPRVIAQRNVAD
jgi:hypothetical protein